MAARVSCEYGEEGAPYDEGGGTWNIIIDRWRNEFLNKKVN